MGINESAYFDEKRGNIYYSAVEDISDAVNSNLESQADPNNGFTEDKTLRKIADIPVSVFHPWARKIGYYAMDKLDRWRSMKMFLREHPEYSTVTALKHNTANQGSIFIK
jgi:hypothetical protein